MNKAEQAARSRRFRGFWCVPLYGELVAVFEHPLGDLKAIVEWEGLREIEPAKTIPCIPRAKEAEEGQSLEKLADKLDVAELEALLDQVRGKDD